MCADEWLHLLEESAVFIEEDVRTAAVRGLSALWQAYYTSPADSIASPDGSSKLSADVSDGKDNTAEDSTTGDNATTPPAPGKGDTSVNNGEALSSSAVSGYLAGLSSQRESQAQGMAVALGESPVILYFKPIVPIFVPLEGR